MRCVVDSFMKTGIAPGLTLSSDKGSHFCAKLTLEFMSRLNILPVFNTPWHPQARVSAEKAIGTLKNLISLLACDHKKS